MRRYKYNVFNRYKLFAKALAVLFFMITVCMPVSVKAEDIKTAGTAGKDYVIDDADILTDDEEEYLQNMCTKKSERCKTDIVIITLKTGKDYSVLDNHIRSIINSDYGYNGQSTTSDAIVFAIDMVSRADRIVTSGNAKSDISQSQLDGIREKAEKKLADGDYFEGCKKYIKGVERYMNTNIFYRLTYKLPIKIVIAALVTLVIILIMRSSAKAKITVNARNYSGNDFKVHQRQDTFINTTVVTRRIERSSSGSSGGGGGGNSGSSGGHF